MPATIRPPWTHDAAFFLVAATSKRRKITVVVDVASTPAAAEVCAAASKFAESDDAVITIDPIGIYSYAKKQ